MRNSRFLNVVAALFVIASACNEGIVAVTLSGVGFLVVLVSVICDSIEKIGAKDEPTRRSTD